MKRLDCIPIFLIVMAAPIYADVFKCKQTSGKISYQPTPCPSGSSAQGVVKVKEMTPEQVEEAKTKLKIWQDEQAANEVLRLREDKERREELRKQESLDLQRRGVAAQEQQMILNQQRQYQGGGLYDPYYRQWNRFPYQPYGPNYFPQQFPHNPPFPPHQDMPPIPPPQPVEPAPITMPGAKDKGNFGFR